MTPNPLLSNVLQYPKDDESARLPPIDIDVSKPDDDTTYEDGARKTEQADGSVVVDLDPVQKSGSPKSFTANLAEHMEQSKLANIASELIEGIERDDQSRKDHLEMISDGIKLLGLVIESNNASQAQSSAPLEGMSTVRHPLLLEACQLFQANAMGELLPAAGPVKIRDDRPQQPEMMGHNGGPPLDNPFAQPAVSPQPGLGAPGAGAPPSLPAGAGAGVQPATPSQMPPVQPMPQGPAQVPAQGPAPQPQAAPIVPPTPPIVPEQPRDQIADAMEKDFNHYLTVTDKGYVPDTDQMLFKTGFGGLGVKKVYNCPLKRMPLSRSIDIEDFIVSNALSDLADARRITHRIKMSPSVVKRMQIVGAYRDITLSAPTQTTDSTNSVDQQKAEVAGVQISTDPRDMDYEILECYCELDLDEYAPSQFEGKGLALPYKVTIEKESRQVLEVRRNWKEDDKECLRKEYFVDFPYMRAFGFYCIGLLHLLGNTTKALTALWREFIDAGMFANFPGFLYLKGAGRQLTNQFRVAPGSGVGLDASVQDIRQAVMPLPYKSPDAAFTAFVTHVEELGQRLGGTANTAVAEGRADAPVGTTLALIEQASKPIGAVNKRLHNSQAREFGLLKERFKDDPEAFWRFNKRPAMQWRKEEFIAALEDYDLVPVSDPNNPTKMHRLAKAEAYKQMVAAAPQAFDQKKAILKYSQEMGLDGVEDTLSPTIGQPAQPQVDPAKMADVQHKNDKLQADTQTAAQKTAAEVQMKQMEYANAEADRQSKLQIAQLSENTERLRLAATLAVHSDKMDEAQKGANIKLISDHVGKAVDQNHELDKLDQTQAHDIGKSNLAHAQGQQSADAAHARAKDLQASQPDTEPQ